MSFFKNLPHFLSSSPHCHSLPCCFLNSKSLSQFLSETSSDCNHCPLMNTLPMTPVPSVKSPIFSKSSVLLTGLIALDNCVVSCVIAHLVLLFIDQLMMMTTSVINWLGVSACCLWLWLFFWLTCMWLQLHDSFQQPWLLLRSDLTI